MNVPHQLVLAVGMTAQAFFSARILVQWVLSERARRVLSPSLFWVFSVAGAYLLCLYGWLRDDFAIILGQFISYYIYLWNLRAKGVWTRLPGWLRGVLAVTPPAAVVWALFALESPFRQFFGNADIPLWLVLFGSAGQVLFTLRFIYQWAYSRHHGESMLPAGFWSISLAGASMIVAYGVMRSDPVLILGQSVGLVAYSRNLYLSLRPQTPSAS